MEQHLEERDEGFSTPRRRNSRPQGIPGWQEALAKLDGRGEDRDQVQDVFSEASQGEIRYHLNLRESRLRDQLVIDFHWANEAGERKPLSITESELGKLSSEEDQKLLSLLLGNSAEEHSRAHIDHGLRFSRSVVRGGMYHLILPQLCRTGRFFSDLSIPGIEPEGPLSWDGIEGYKFQLRVDRLIDQQIYQLWGHIVRERDRIDLETPKLILASGLAMVDQRVIRVELDEGFDWAFRLRRHGAVQVPEHAKDDLLVQLSAMQELPEVQLPPELHWSQVRLEPGPRVSFYQEETPSSAKYVVARVSFDYGGQLVPVNARQAAVADANGRRLFRRDFEKERAFLRHLASLGIEPASDTEQESGEIRLPKADIQQMVRQLVDEGWFVEADGAPMRTAGAMSTKVSSGLEWFDVESSVDYGDGVKAELPALIRAVKEGQEFVELSDGSNGMIPDWAKGYAALAKVAKGVGDRLRFLPSQAGIIEALLHGHEDVEVDIKFERLRENLQNATEPDQIVEPKSFKGKLRDYQREGLSWMRFLEDYRYGGCLADDMGLGKTVQVLCLLAGRHRPESGEKMPPSLIVVPKSLVYNWIEEAGKFTDLKAIDYTGPGRLQYRDRLEEFDLIVTTYGTLRQEILRLLEVEFTSVILDEAQAIKNPRSQAAKACRLIQAQHRLAISGTPIENSLDELWSLFEFANPGMLGPLDEFGTGGKEKNEEWLDLLSKALRPFMLRRTKEQVLTELPGKTELTLMVDMKEEEWAKYQELKNYYQAAIDGLIEKQGLSKSKIHVLEALLRLRQAACHPGLIDPAKMDDTSSKLEVLFEKLLSVVKAGHKVLIFSQFTTLLEIVKRRLIREGVGYEYLDGGTPDRRATVANFQQDPDCAVFLISLKAGGCGLNLTQSDYVFILDPWWNPAVEAQAIDRAHRMGQKNPVFAYRMISRNTVEEKIMTMQENKRRLADAVVCAENVGLKNLSIDDLQKIFE